MKKTLIAAALVSAALASPTISASAAETTITKTGVDAVCFLLPLLPDCVAQWAEEYEANGFQYKAIPVAWWTCEVAAENTGHLLDCDA
jgi:hypothetical protein